MRLAERHRRELALGRAEGQLNRELLVFLGNSPEAWRNFQEENL
jgi:hypothetical protein